jgi:hypothetical protein
MSGRIARAADLAGFQFELGGVEIQLIITSMIGITITGANGSSFCDPLKRKCFAACFDAAKHFFVALRSAADSLQGVLF